MPHRDGRAALDRAAAPRPAPAPMPDALFVGWPCSLFRARVHFVDVFVLWCVGNPTVLSLPTLIDAVQPVRDPAGVELGDYYFQVWMARAHTAAEKFDQRVLNCRSTAGISGNAVPDFRGS